MDSNPQLPQVDLTPIAQPPAPPAEMRAPHAENPPWTAIDLLIGAFAFLAVLFVSTTVFLSVAAHTTGIPYLELAKNPSAIVVVPAMTTGYLALLAALYIRLATSQEMPFWTAMGWRWPVANQWLGFVVIGALMALGLPLLSHLLPFPKSLPMDRFFHDPHAAYLMMFMGVAVAPLAEEVTFRGFLYPVLDRWLQTLFMVRRQLFSGSKWLILMIGWGYVVHRTAGAHSLGTVGASAVSLLVALFAFLPVGFLFFDRWLRSKPHSAILVSGIVLCIWGVLSRTVSERTFRATSLELLVLSIILAAIGAAGGLSPTVAGRLGRILAVLVTSSVFAMVHAEQLGGAWGPLLVILTVGLVLTITRVVTRSVAPGFLIHVAYNFTLFCALYFGTDHFRHLERINQ